MTSQAATLYNLLTWENIELVQKLVVALTYGEIIKW